MRRRKEDDTRTKYIPIRLEERLIDRIDQYAHERGLLHQYGKTNYTAVIREIIDLFLKYDEKTRQIAKDEIKNNEMQKTQPSEKVIEIGPKAIIDMILKEQKNKKL